MVDGIQVREGGVSPGAAGPTESGGVLGKFHGRSVQVKEDAASLVADAAEELSFQAAESVEKKIEKRRIGKEKKQPSTQMVNKILNVLPDLDQEDLAQWMVQCRKDRPGSMQALLRSLQRYFGDVSHQYAALTCAEDSFADDPELLEQIRQAKGELEAAYGPQVRSGLNITETAYTFAQNGLGQTNDLRQFYRDTVLEYEGLSQMMESIAQRFPAQFFGDAVKFMIRAVGADLHSQGSSIEPGELKKILDDLYNLESIGTLHQQCEQLVAKTIKGFGLSSDVDPQRVLRDFFSLKEKDWLTDRDVENLVAQVTGRNPGAKIYFLQGLIDVARQVPMKLFPSDEARINFLEKMQSVLDQYIEDEE